MNQPMSFIHFLRSFTRFLIHLSVVFSFSLISGSLPTMAASADSHIPVTAAAPDFHFPVMAAAPDFHSQAKSAILMEASTGTILYEQDADSRRPPASVTKVMTLLLIFDALDEGTLRLDDTVTVSEHAASMGGSQVFLETGESQDVDTMIKCIAVASGNDACVAMAEHIAGSEEAFVEKMNARARKLGMTNTHFVNCCGLDAEEHYSCARDIAIMSRELINRYPEVFHYTGIWMDHITHVTRRGASEFGLTNTNKLIRYYKGATGLKTGSTSKAGFCLSATAERNNISLIAVVMNCDSSKARVAACSSLLDYGFANCHLYKDEQPPDLSPVPVYQGRTDFLTCQYGSLFSWVGSGQIDPAKIVKKLSLDKAVRAPVKKGQTVGKLNYYYGEELLGSVDIIAGESIPKAGYLDCSRKLLYGILY